MDLPHRGDARIEDVPGGLRARLDIDPSISSCRRWRRDDPRFGYAQPARAACDSRITRSNKRKPSSRRHPNAATRPLPGRRHADMRLITVLDVGNTSGGGKGCEGCDPTGHRKGGWVTISHLTVHRSYEPFRYGVIRINCKNRTVICLHGIPFYL